MIIAGFALSGCKNTSNNLDSEPTLSAETNVTELPIAEEPKENNNKIKSGTYKVGTDIPVGEYLLFADERTYIEIATQNNANIDIRDPKHMNNENFGGSLIHTDFLMYGGTSYITLEDGGYFRFLEGEMDPS